MPLFDPMAGLFGAAPGTGVLAAPQTITNPLQNPLGPEAMAVEAANAQERLKRNAVLRAQLKAAALKDEPGIVAHPGVGPMGWAVGAANAIVGAIERKRRLAAAQEVAKGMGEQAPAENTTNAAINAARRQTLVPQGSPLSLSDQ